jgi:hypothetical protein
MIPLISLTRLCKLEIRTTFRPTDFLYNIIELTARATTRFRSKDNFVESLAVEVLIRRVGLSYFSDERVHLALCNERYGTSSPAGTYRKLSVN